MTTGQEDFSVNSVTLAALERPINLPHVVILGAGASIAAFPDGDIRGRKLPSMKNLAQVLDLDELITNAGYDPNENFELIYSKFHSDNPDAVILQEIEAKVEDYFSKLSLPDHLTIYDLLLLSLREKDAIFTFNWDPFLVDTYLRHEDHARLPPIFHLHGNVRVAFCDKCDGSTVLTNTCPRCGGDLTPSRLLYPIAQKNYSDDPYIATQWDAARKFIREAFLVTIFGYSAPTTDQEAMAIFAEAWKGLDQDRIADRVQVIDVRDSDELAEQWSEFSYYEHYDICRSFFESLHARYPRRTCEAWYNIGVNGKYTHCIPWTTNMVGLKKAVADLQAHESSDHLS